MDNTMKLRTPFADLNHPLSSEEFESLRISIEAEGVRDPIWIDEDGNILDGHHRYKIAPDAPTRVKAGLSLAEKKAFVRRTARDRRNSSPEQKAEGRARDIEIARELKADGKRQEDIAADLGVDQSTVARWLDVSNMHPHKANTDCRVTLPKAARAELLERVETGEETQAAIAADYGISRSRVSQLYTAERERRAQQAERDKIKAGLKAEGVDPKSVKVPKDDVHTVVERVETGKSPTFKDAVEFVVGPDPDDKSPPKRTRGLGPIKGCVGAVMRLMRESLDEMDEDQRKALFPELRKLIDHMEKTAA